MRLVIVGGVAAGMSCAARARRLSEDAEIVVLERGQHVSFANCGLPYHVSREIDDAAGLVLQTPESLRAALRLDVRLGAEAVGLDPRAKTVRVRDAAGERHLSYDALVLAPGAEPVAPPIPGLDEAAATPLRSVPDAVRLREIVDGGARSAVVLGAGFIGVETAEALAARGLEVSLVEMADHVLPPLEPELAFVVAQELRRIGVAVHAPAAATAVAPGEVRLADGARLAADVIVLATGVRPATDWTAGSGLALERGAILVDERGRTSLDGVWAAGDATAAPTGVTGVVRPTPLAGPANRAGRRVADDVFGRGRAIPPALGSSVLRAGELTIAMVGANRAELRRQGVAHRSVRTHPLNHAGYFPGAQGMRLVAHYAPDGRLLGAQGVGGDGVDKRIDVLAAAMRAGVRVDELIDLDLAYAPPYGSAKDPVNMLGMVAENEMGGLLAQWEAEDYERVRDQALLLDARSGDEFAEGALPGAVNVPHTQTRERLGEIVAWADGRPVRVYCRSGVRSYLAHRVLAGAGLDSASLSGGMLTFEAARPDVGLVEGGSPQAGEPAERMVSTSEESVCAER